MSVCIYTSILGISEFSVESFKLNSMSIKDDRFFLIKSKRNKKKRIENNYTLYLILFPAFKTILTPLICELSLVKKSTVSATSSTVSSFFKG